MYVQSCHNSTETPSIEPTELTATEGPITFLKGLPTSCVSDTEVDVPLLEPPVNENPVELLW